MGTNQIGWLIDSLAGGYAVGTFLRGGAGDGAVVSINELLAQFRER